MCADAIGLDGALIQYRGDASVVGTVSCLGWSVVQTNAPHLSASMIHAAVLLPPL